MFLYANIFLTYTKDDDYLHSFKGDFMITKLQNTQFFCDLSLDEIDTLIKSNIIQIKHYKKGQTLHCQGKQCTFIDIVLSGNLTSYNLAENGATIAMFNFTESSIIGCNLLFSNINRYPLNIYCTSDCSIAHINKDNVSLLLAKNKTFMFEFIKSISNYSLNMNRKMLTFARKNLRESLISYLNKETKIQQSNTITLPISKKQLADELGVQRPSLFRELKKMRDEHIIDYDSKTITLLKKIFSDDIF